MAMIAVKRPAQGAKEERLRATLSKSHQEAQKRLLTAVLSKQRPELEERTSAFSA